MSRTAILLASISVLALSPAAAEEFRLGHVATEASIHHKMIGDFADRVRAETAGRVDFKIFPAGQLGSEVEQVEGALIGAIDGVALASGALSNFVPELRILDLPYIFDDTDHFKRVWDGPFAAKVDEAAAAKNIKFLCASSTGFRNILTTSPVNSIDDLKNRKIRTIQSPVHIAAFNGFGALATPLPYTEVYSGLQTGLIDGADAGNQNYEDAKFYEVAPHWALVGWVPTSYLMVMSKLSFDRLSAEDQAIVTKAAKDGCTWLTDTIAAGEVETLQRLESKGVKITRPDLAPFKASSEPQRAAYVGDDPVRKEWNQLMQDAK